MSGDATELGIAGFVLFTLGLLIGFAIPAVRNPRMGLSAHLTAAQTGPALIAVALFWNALKVPAAWTPWLIHGLAGSAYVLVAGILLAAIVGASEALPIAGGAHRASGLNEAIVSVLVKGSSLVMAAACLAICYCAITGMTGG